MDFNKVLDGALVAAGETPSRLLYDSYMFEIGTTFIPGGTIVDIGGGVSVKNAVLSRLGMRVVVFDLFETYYDCAPSGTYDIRQRKLACLDAGVELVNADIFDVDMIELMGGESVDFVTSLHVFEHLHRSPKPIVEQAMKILKLGGQLHIEVPNAANLRKRLNLFLGHTNYPEFMSFYDKPVWHGHVREYTKGDLCILAEQIGYPFVIYGRNYFGSLASQLPHYMHPIVDRVLRPFPGLCGSLFLDVTKC